MHTSALLPALSLLATILATPAAAASLAGDWVPTDGGTGARIAACAADPATLCAALLPPAPAGQVVLKDLAPRGDNMWRGQYRHGKDWLPATVWLREANKVEMKVCRWVLCQSATYRRADTAAFRP